MAWSKSISAGGSIVAAERLLHIDASPRGERSRSRRIAVAFVDRLAEVRPDIEVTRLDPWTRPLPPLGDGMIEGRYDLIMGRSVDRTLDAAWADVRREAEYFLSFDGYLISTPMWNFGIPYRLKHYIDVLTQPGMTFLNDAAGAVIGKARGRKAVVIGASALDIRPAGPLASLDFQLTYLAEWLRFIGVESIETLRVAPTFGAEADVQSAMRVGETAARRLAESYGEGGTAARV